MKILREYIKEIILENNPGIPVNWTLKPHSHITLAFGKDMKRWEPRYGHLLGQKINDHGITANITSICHDNKVIACRVSIELPDELKDENTKFCNNENPHITIATAPGIPPKQSNDMLQNPQGEQQMNISLDGTIKKGAGFISIEIDDDVIQQTIHNEVNSKIFNIISESKQSLKEEINDKIFIYSRRNPEKRDGWKTYARLHTGAEPAGLRVTQYQNIDLGEFETDTYQDANKIHKQIKNYLSSLVSSLKAPQQNKDENPKSERDYKKRDSESMKEKNADKPTTLQKVKRFLTGGFKNSAEK